jgi:methylmalonyl-CoA/ethylmalonyl-CoA epimerase
MSAEKRAGVKEIAHVAIVVRNLEETMRRYWEVLGIGPWEICDAKPPVLHGQYYDGKPADFTYRLAFARVGSTSLELVQPLSGRSSYSDFLEKHGEGLHHIGFAVASTQDTTRALNQAGCRPIMGGGFKDGAFVYYDTEGALKCVWEAVTMPEEMPPMTRYPE